jgi:hypothetical protein
MANDARSLDAADDTTGTDAAQAGQCDAGLGDAELCDAEPVAATTGFPACDDGSPSPRQSPTLADHARAFFRH